MGLNVSPQASSNFKLSLKSRHRFHNAGRTTSKIHERSKTVYISLRNREGPQSSLDMCDPDLLALQLMSVEHFLVDGGIAFLPVFERWSSFLLDQFCNTEPIVYCALNRKPCCLAVE